MTTLGACNGDWPQAAAAIAFLVCVTIFAVAALYLGRRYESEDDKQ